MLNRSLSGMKKMFRSVGVHYEQVLLYHVGGNVTIVL
jgi:hypothetical protein